MSLIVHRCNHCGHIDTRRDGTVAGPVADTVPADKQRACCRRRDWSEPQIIPSWSWADGPFHGIHPDPTLQPPGTVMSPGVTTCACDQCKALYASETAA